MTGGHDGSSQHLMLVGLPDGDRPELVADALRCEQW
jgi:hypothetical protein